MMEKIVLNVTGMSCSHCEKAITDDLMELDGVINVVADAKTNSVSVEFDGARVSLDKIKEQIIETGYVVA